MNLQVQLESAIDSAFRYGHGWPAVFSVIVLFLLYTLGCVKVLEIIEDIRVTRAIRREKREASSPAARQRERDAAVPRPRRLANVEPVSAERERQVLEAMASIGSQPLRALPGERTIRVPGQ